MPNLSPSWSDVDSTYPSAKVQGVDDTPGPKAYLIQLEAKKGHQDSVAAFMKDINAGVELEPGTGPWFGLRYSETTFAIFEAFPDAQRRHDHDAGPGGQNFARLEELRDMLAHPAQIYRLDVLHGKFGTMMGQKVEFDKQKLGL